MSQVEPESHASFAVSSAFEHAPAGMLVCAGPDHMVVAVNAAARGMVGEHVLGRPYRVGMPDLTGQGLYEMFDESYRTGKTLTADRWRVVREPGAPTTENFYTFSLSAWHAADGSVGGVMITAVDVTEEVLAETASTRRYAAARDVVWALQRNLLPDGMPILPDLRLAAQYHVAGAEMQAGGDWFDVVVVDGSRVALVVGDVVGHGPAAAAAMARLSPVLHELLTAGTGLADALDRLDRFAAQRRATRAATVCVALLDPSTGRLEFGTRGHLSPLVCAPDGKSTLLSGGTAGPLGVDAGASRTATGQLDRDAVLLLSSDGLWERPDSTAEEDQQHLMTAASAAMTASSQRIPSVVDRVCQFTVEFQARTGFSDDVTLLAATRPVDRSVELALETPSVVDCLDELHSRTRAWLTELGVGSDQIEDLTLAVYEAAANAALHAYVGRRTGTTRVTGELRTDGTLLLRIADRGRWRSPRDSDVGGRGLAIMRAVADDLEVDNDGQGTTVTLTARVLHPTVVGTGDIPAGPPRRSDQPFAVQADDTPWPILRVSGPVDVRTAPILRRAISNADTGGSRPVLVDLSDVTFLSSAGVQLLHELASPNLRLAAAASSIASHVLELNALEYLLHQAP